jgi:hypothetical protein
VWAPLCCDDQFRDSQNVTPVRAYRLQSGVHAVQPTGARADKDSAEAAPADNALWSMPCRAGELVWLVAARGRPDVLLHVLDAVLQSGALLAGLRPLFAALLQALHTVQWGVLSDTCSQHGRASLRPALK